MPIWNKIVRNYFTFNKREKRGLIVLLSVLFLLIAVHFYIKLQPVSKFELTAEQQLLIEEFAAHQSEEGNVSSDSAIREEVELTEIKWHSFDPNSASNDELVKLGLDSTLSQRLINYRSKGGYFKNVSDVKKIYGMDDEWLGVASLHMTFEAHKKQSIEQIESEKPFDSESIKTSISKIELNRADSAELVSLPWIGPFYASEIVELRSNLGGFNSYDQLLSIYRISDKAIESLIEYSTLDTLLINHININTCDLKKLGYHPYLSWKQAKVIVNYRIQHGPYTKVADIKKTDIVPDSTYLKIAPYLTLK